MKPPDTIIGRLYVVFAVLLALPVMVLFQMFRMHVEEGALLRLRGEAQAESYIELAAQRGSIFDRNGRALVVNTARYQVSLDPGFPGFRDREDELVALLSEATGQSQAHFRSKIDNPTSPRYVVLARDVDAVAQEKLQEADIPGLILEGRFARRYVYGNTGAHILGHVNSDFVGLAGLELSTNEFLEGVPGRQAVQRDRQGRIKGLVGGQVIEPTHGEHLVLTIDLVRQAILEEELARGVEEMAADWGTAIAMDPHTGAILAMANAPTYDPNRPAAFSDAARRNHAITDRVEPGSTFKLITAIAAVENGVINLEDQIDTGNGYADVGGRPLRDTHGHGVISVGEAIVVSSNIGMAKVGERVGSTRFYEMARSLGFGQPTYVDLPGEVAGSLREPSGWSRPTLSRMSIGYGVSVTPLQLVTAYAALANGGLLVKPYIVAERRDVQNRVLWEASQDSIRRAFRPETAERLLPYMEKVVSEKGTARRAAVPGLRVAGKTGTARTATGGGYVGRYRASFAGLFPAEDPEVVLLVLMDNPRNGGYGGVAAAPVFSRVARRWIGTFPTIAQRVAPPSRVSVRDTVAVPSVDTLPGTLAAERLRAEGFDVQLSDRDLWQPVRLEDSGQGRWAPLDAPLRLQRRTASDEARMPDLRGLSPRQAVAWLRALGVAPRFEGRGVVTAQYPAPGSELPARATLTLGRSSNDSRSAAEPPDLDRFADPISRNSAAMPLMRSTNLPQTGRFLATSSFIRRSAETQPDGDA